MTRPEKTPLDPEAPPARLPEGPEAAAASAAPPRGWTLRDAFVGLLLAFVLVLVNDAYVASRVGVLHGPDAQGTGFTNESDHYLYITMAADSAVYYQDRKAHIAPFCYRVLTPWLARVLTQLGLGTDAAFYLIAHVGLLGFLTGLYLWLLALGVERRLAVLGLVLAAGMQGAVRWYSLQYWMTDPVALFLLVLGFHFVRGRRWSALAATSVLGMLNKDTYLIFFSYVFLAELRRVGLRAAVLRTLQVSWVGLLVAALLRHYVVQDQAKSFLDTVLPIFRWRLEFWPIHLYTATLGSLGVLLALLLLLPGRIVAHVRTWYPELFVGFGYVATLFVATNTDRELAYALPAFLPIAMLNLGAWLQRSRVPFFAVAVALVAVQGLFWWRTDFTEPSIQLVRYDVVAAIALVWVAGLALVALRGRTARV